MKFRGYDLQVGDAIFTYQNSWLNKRIFWFSKWRVPKKNRKDKIAHVALFIGGNIPQIAEADWKGIVIKNLDSYEGKKWTIHAGRPKGLKLTDKKRITLQGYALGKSGESYAFMQLAAIAVKKIFGLNKIGDWDKDSMICSEFYATAIEQCFDIDVVPGQEHFEISPLDIYHSKNMRKLKSDS